LVNFFFCNRSSFFYLPQIHPVKYVVASNLVVFMESTLFTKNIASMQLLNRGTAEITEHKSKTFLKFLFSLRSLRTPRPPSLCSGNSGQVR
jgi:hypothetical protein